MFVSKQTVLTLSRQQLSPEKYIQTRARTLPVYKCFVNPGWEKSGLANILVLRSHVTGNVTAGLYLVDLKCLGVKDTFYHFNRTEAEIMNLVDNSGLVEADYVLVHNIIYAGHDYAYEFEIAPHKDFALTKYILEEDDDNIEMLEVHTGDEEGKPMLVVDSHYPAGPILQKLKQHAGEGNFNYIIGGHDEDGDDFDDEGNDDDEYLALADIEDGELDFDNVKEISALELKNAIENRARTSADMLILMAEYSLRVLLNTRPELFLPEEDIMHTTEFEQYEAGEALWDNMMDETYASDKTGFRERLLEASNIAGIDNMNAEEKEERLWQLYYEYREDEVRGEEILDILMPFQPEFYYENLSREFAACSPLSRLYITACWVISGRELPAIAEKIVSAPSVHSALPGVEIHAEHCRVFWLIKSSIGIKENNAEIVLLYYQLLSVTGINLRLRYLYAANLTEWLIHWQEKNDGPSAGTDEALKTAR